MDSITIILAIIILILAVSLVFYVIRSTSTITALKQKMANAATPYGNAVTLKINAHERLTLFAERTKLPNLVNRLYNSAFTAMQMQQILLKNIKEEYEHNITQQLYVKPELWAAIIKMKEQNTYIVNQIAHTIPASASALDLNKMILDFCLNNPQSSINNLVQNALQFEMSELLK